MDPLTYIQHAVEFLNAPIENFNVNQLHGLTSLLQRPHKAVIFAKGQMRVSLLVIVSCTIWIFMMLMNHSWEFYYTSLFSTVLIYTIFLCNIVNLIPKVSIYIKYTKIDLRQNKIAIRNHMINNIFNRRIYKMSMLCTLFELFFHIVGFFISAKYFFKSKQSYLAEMTTNQLHEKYMHSLHKKFNIKTQFEVNNPANVDLFMLKYCFIFFLKVSIAYYRFRKNFLKPRDKLNPFDLEVFLYTSNPESIKDKNKAETKKIVKYLRTINNDPHCSICYKQYEENDSLVNFECNNSHFFHLNCITNWMHRAPTCPLCRRGLFQ